MSYDLTLSSPIYAGRIDVLKTDLHSGTLAPNCLLTSEQQGQIRDRLSQLGYEISDIRENKFWATSKAHKIAILVAEAEISFSIPYWFDDTKLAKETLNKIEATIKMIETLCGFVTFDPQIGRIINIEHEMNSMLAVYLHTTRNMNFIAHKNKSKGSTHTLRNFLERVVTSLFLRRP